MEHPVLNIKEVKRNGRNRHLFRQIARDSSGEVFDPPDEEIVFMAYQIDRFHGEKLVGVGSCVLADPSMNEPGKEFLSEYYNCLSYLFIASRFKGIGYGTQLLKFMENRMIAHMNRPVRTQAAVKAVRFFVNNGYNSIGDSFETVCCGSPLFSRLQNMQKEAI